MFQNGDAGWKKSGNIESWAEIKASSAENPEVLKLLLLRACSVSEYSFACFVCCQFCLYYVTSSALFI